MGKLIEFPTGRVLDEGLESEVDRVAREALEGMGYEFPVKEAVKSSTSVMKASVCQKCGCKLDGQVASMRPGCACGCHEGRIR